MLVRYVETTPLYENGVPVLLADFPTPENSKQMRVMFLVEPLIQFFHPGGIKHQGDERAFWQQCSISNHRNHFEQR